MKARLALVAAILAALFCMAQSPMSAFPPGIFDNKGAQAPAPPVYIGPGDSSVTPNAAFWGSCARAYSAAYAASRGNMCLLYGVTTTTTCQEVANPSGFADWNSALSCVGGTVTVNTFCTVTNTSCTVETLDDQTGNLASPPTQATNSNRPTLDLGASGLNSLPVMDTSASTTIILASVSTVTSSQPITFNGVYIRTSGTNTRAVIETSSANCELATLNSANEAHLNCGTAQNPTATDNAWHSISMEANAASGAYNVDGTDTASVNIGSNTLSSVGIMVGEGVNGKIAEVGVWLTPNDLSTPTLRGNLFSNQNSVNGYGGLL